MVSILFTSKQKSYKGAFNNYVDKKGGRGGQQKVHACPPRREGGLWMSTWTKIEKKSMANDYEVSSDLRMQYIEDG